MKDIVISAKDFEWRPEIFEKLVKEFSQGHNYRIRLHFRAVSPAVWWMDGGVRARLSSVRDENC